MITFLQPWPRQYLQSAICFVSAMFSERDESMLDREVRVIQASYLATRIERANSEFQLPVIIGVALNDEPSSPAYHILRTGRVQLRQEAPRKCKPPRVVPTSRGSVKVYWFPPYITIADPGITAYLVSWRPGGSTSVGFRTQKEINSGECIQYVFKFDENGVRRTVPLDELTMTITGLTSNIPYEFKVAAVNIVGQGVWSESSPIVALSSKPSVRNPPHPPLQNLKDVEQVKTEKEAIAMAGNDFDPTNAASNNPHKSETHLSPRVVEGGFDFEVPRYGSFIFLNELDVFLKLKILSFHEEVEYYQCLLMHEMVGKEHIMARKTRALHLF